MNNTIDLMTSHCVKEYIKSSDFEEILKIIINFLKENKLQQNDPVNMGQLFNYLNIDRPAHKELLELSLAKIFCIRDKKFSRMLIV